jgi:hypothetical protein
MNRLLEIGFQPVGHWRMDADVPTLDLKALAAIRNILYAFVTDGEVKYIGKTTQPLKTRMLGYQRPAPTQTTNIRNNRNIRELLKQGKSVDIFALPDNGLLHYGAFHINLAAGLEDGLIAKINPEWNGQREVENASMITDEATVGVNALNINSTSPIPSDEMISPISDVNPKFTLTLHRTYFNQGFFNVSIDCQHYFGSDLEKINIYCGSEQLQIIGYINRTANTNGTPRIMGGAQLKQWIQKSATEMGSLNVEIVAQNSIRLTVLA